MTNLCGPERATVYKISVTDTSGHTDVRTCGTFEELSKTIDAAMASPGFARYEVGPAGDL